MDLDYSVEKNVSLLAEAKNTTPNKITVCVLDRPRHNQIISSLKEGGQEDIKQINAVIISLSKKDKNYILGTFIIQFVIFLIIQFTSFFFFFIRFVLLYHYCIYSVFLYSFQNRDLCVNDYVRLMDYLDHIFTKHYYEFIRTMARIT